jgi:hypothetical protein
VHHSSQPDGEVMKKLRDALAPKNMPKLADYEKMQLGATGKYPEGKLTPKDEGEIKFVVVTTDGKVVINFGTPITWIGFSPQQARELAETIRRISHQAEGK